MHKKIRGMLIALWIFTSKIPYGKTLKIYRLLPIYIEKENGNTLWRNCIIFEIMERVLKKANCSKGRDVKPLA